MVPVRDLNHQPLSVGIGHGDRCEVRLEEFSGASADHHERLIRSRSRENGVRDLAHRFEPALAPSRLLVEPGILDRDARLRGEHENSLFVLLGELRCALLLGQIDVAEDLAAGDDRGTEERPHRRVVRRESVAPRVLGDVGDPDWRSIRPPMDQDAEDAVSDRQIPDRLSLLGRKPGRDEVGQPSLFDHAERTVARARDLGRELDDALQHRREGELRRQDEAGPDQLVASIHAS